MSRKTILFSGSTIAAAILIAIFYLPQTLKQRSIQQKLQNYTNSPIPAAVVPTLTPTPFPSPSNKSALEIASEKKRQTDLLNLVNALYLYVVKNTKLPEDFPTKPTCIGTDPQCYSLDFLVPDQISQIPQDPHNGTAQNTGYYIFLDDGRLTASASSGVTIRK